MTPNKPRIRKWVDALRSGEYRQGVHQLRHGDNFCCLGVACDVAAKAGVGKWDGNRFITESPSGSECWDSEVLPMSVRHWLGLDSDNPIPTQTGRGNSLAERNDNGHSFKRIADAIERKYLR